MRLSYEDLVPSPDTNPGPWPSEGHALLLSYEGSWWAGSDSNRHSPVFQTGAASVFQLPARGGQVMVPARPRYGSCPVRLWFPTGQVMVPGVGVTQGSQTPLPGATARCLNRSASVTLRGPSGPIGDPAGS